MRRIVTWTLSTVTVLVLLFSYHTSTSSTVAPAEQVSAAGAGAAAGGSASGGAASGGAASGGAAADGGTTQGGSGSGSSSASGNSGSSGSAAAPSSGATTFAGDAVDTRFGAVQVQITVASGKITAVDVLQVPDRDRRDQEINSQAVPILNQEAVQAQSAQIDSVSGATYTSDGYVQSLQSAIDQAHL